MYFSFDKSKRDKMEKTIHAHLESQQKSNQPQQNSKALRDMQAITDKWRRGEKL